MAFSSPPYVPPTTQVFRGYYLAKIQGELLEVNIRQAWDDLHYGTGKTGNAVPRTIEIFLVIMGNTSTICRWSWGHNARNKRLYEVLHYPVTLSAYVVL